MPSPFLSCVIFASTPFLFCPSVYSPATESGRHSIKRRVCQRSAITALRSTVSSSSSALCASASAASTAETLA